MIVTRMDGGGSIGVASDVTESCAQEVASYTREERPCANDGAAHVRFEVRVRIIIAVDRNRLLYFAKRSPFN